MVACGLWAVPPPLVPRRFPSRGALPRLQPADPGMLVIDSQGDPGLLLICRGWWRIHVGDVVSMLKLVDSGEFFLHLASAGQGLFFTAVLQVFYFGLFVRISDPISNCNA